MYTIIWGDNMYVFVRTTNISVRLNIKKDWTYFALITKNICLMNPTHKHCKMHTLFSWFWKVVNVVFKMLMVQQQFLCSNANGFPFTWLTIIYKLWKIKIISVNIIVTYTKYVILCVHVTIKMYFITKNWKKRNRIE